MRGLAKVIGMGAISILTIWGVRTVVTMSDVEQQYKQNTGKDLTIDKSELSSFSEAAQDWKELMQKLNKKDLDCKHYQYGFYASCEDVKGILAMYKMNLSSSITCYSRLAAATDLQKSDLWQCLSSEKDLKSIERTLAEKTVGYCDADCKSAEDARDFNIAFFESHLKKLE